MAKLVKNCLKALMFVVILLLIYASVPLRVPTTTNEVIGGGWRKKPMKLH